MRVYFVFSSTVQGVCLFLDPISTMHECIKTLKNGWHSMLALMGIGHLNDF